jgi:putative hemolysin
MEDLVEELVGDIHDEYDADARAEGVRRRGAGPVEVDGLLSIEDFDEETGIVLQDGPYETVAGWFVATRGALPELGDAVTDPGSGAVFEVIELDGRRIARLRVTPAPVGHRAGSAHGPAAASGGPEPEPGPTP